jgi:Tol biopolymer transport system component
VVGDRGDNVLVESVSFSLLDGPVSVDTESGVVTTSTFGTARVIGRMGSKVDTVRVTAVPQGALAASKQYGQLVVMNLDGTAVRQLADVGFSPTWSPAGDRIIYDPGAGGRLAGGRLVVQSLYGVPTPFLDTDTTRGRQGWPKYSRDGRWVYFDASAPGAAQEIWRAGADGLDLQRISPLPGEGHPSPSPDGARIAYFFDTDSTIFIRVRDLTTGQVSGNLAMGHTPVWSPTEDLIAFNELDRLRRPTGLMLVRPDGSGLRRLNLPGYSYKSGIDWSPDGRWIIAAGYPRVHLIEVATGLVIELPYLEGVSSVAWRPGGLLP